MAKDIKVVYYVDVDDDTKGCLCAIPSDKNMRNNDVVDFIADEIHSILGLICHLTMEDCKELAVSIAYNQFANTHEYEFGVEEIIMFD